MRVVLQRVSRASVAIAGEVVGEIGDGLLVFVAAGRGDGESQAVSLANKAAELRIFSDADGKTNLSLLDVGGSALVISQFTLYADCRRGRRPSFSDAADPGPAEALVERFRQALEERGVPTATGRFGADMLVSLDNVGPFTILLDSEELTRPRRAERSSERSGRPGGASSAPNEAGA